HSASHSVSTGQVLPRPYRFDEARLVLREMIDMLCTEMLSKNVSSGTFTWWVSYDYKSLEHCPDYAGPVCVDFYGRLHPCHSGGTVRISDKSNVAAEIAPSILDHFDAGVHHGLLFRRLGICAANTVPFTGARQLSFFTDWAQQEKELHLQRTMLDIRKRYGAGAVFRACSLMEGATALERIGQIGGHRA
ncbi:MAG: hypothetical protein IJ088_04750, partial [Clostridia bacterium]|nr:hypothetical protein [Clostridia bacterium]